MLSPSFAIACLELARVIADLAIVWLVQSTLLITAGLALAWVLSRWGAAAQSIVYRATLAAILLCPFFSWFLTTAGFTGYSLAIPSAWSAPAPGAAELSAPPAVRAPSEPATSPSLPSSTAMGQPTFPGGPVPPLGQSTSRYELSENSGDLLSPPIVQAVAKPNENLPRSDLSSQSPLSASLTPWGVAAAAFCLLWILISGAGLLHLALAWRRLARIRQRAVAADEATRRLCRELAQRLRVKTPLLLVTPFLPGPCLTGWRRPAILLPESTGPQSLGDVLTHELAHLVRHDVPWHLLRKCATSLFFFQPLLWYLSRRIEITAEEVCDDWVVEHGHDRAEYARRLVEVAELSGVPTALAGVAMISHRSILAQRVARIMDQGRTLSTATSRALVVAILSFIGLGALAMGLVQAAPRNLPPGTSNHVEAISPTSAQGEPHHPETGEVAIPLANDQLLPSREKKGEEFIVRGQVRTPDGKPAGGARVFITRQYWTGALPWTPLGSAVADSNGRFALQYHDPSLDGRGTGPSTISAQAEGYGVQWQSLAEINPSKPVVLNLVPEYPIKGRIFDLEGKPVAGVAVRIFQIFRPKPGENLDAWIEAVKAGTLYPLAKERLGDFLPGMHEAGANAAANEIRSDKDGRFVIRGVGAEHVAEFEVRHEAIAYRVVSAATRAMGPIARNLWMYSGFDFPPTKDTVYGGDFTYPAPPTRVVQGTVRDATTGEPIAGLEIESDFIAGSDHLPKGMLRTKTDAQGRYRFVGLPEGDGPNLSDYNVIRFLPNGEIPYLMRMVTVPSSRDPGAQILDVKLSRGIWISGRVTDKETGKPVRACVQYLPFLDNPNTFDRPEFPANGNMDGDTYWIISDAEGRYRTPGLPGRAVMVAFALGGKYIPGVGASEIAGMDENGRFATYRANGNANSRWFHGLKEINPDKETTKVGCDFVLDPGASTRLTILDDQGQPLSGCTANSVEGESSGTGELVVKNLAPSEARQLHLSHSGKDLGKIVVIAWKDKQPQPMTVTLEKCATVKGKLVGLDGKPLSAVHIKARPVQNLWPFGPAFTQADGTFVLPHIPTGSPHYTLYTLRDIMEVELIPKKVEIKAGETVDLGTLKVDPTKWVR